MPALMIWTADYSAEALQRWKAGEYSSLTSSKASEFLRDTLSRKARTRRDGRIARGKDSDRRFFGEAFVSEL